MGWYLDKENCPNCSQEATVMFRSSCLESYYLVCPHCGLYLYCSDRKWIPTKSFIDKNSIGKIRDDLDFDELYDLFKSKEDEKIVTTPQ
jgi:transcription elongation factor Elf1